MNGIVAGALDPARPPATLPNVLPSPGRWAGLSRVFRTIGPDLFESLRAAGHRKLVVQVPAGLIRDSQELLSRIRAESGAATSLLARACFGACDFPSPDETAGADGVVVLGHAPIPNVPLALPTYFVEMREPRGNVETLADLVRTTGLPSRIGLVASVQHLDLLPPLGTVLAERGHQCWLGTGDRRLAYAAQALGCNYTGAESIAEDVDAFLFVGTGRFHPLGLALAVNRPVYSLDPIRELMEPPIHRDQLIRERQLLVARTRDAQRFGILVSTFAGQNRSSTALVLQRKALERGRQAELLLFGRLDPSDLEGRAVDAFVNTACPRIALDDWRQYSKPMLTPPEFLMALGELPLEPYRFDTYH